MRSGENLLRCPLKMTGKIMGTALLQAIGSFAAGAIAWVVLEFFGRPLRKFYDLRGETVYRLAKVANVRSIGAVGEQTPSGDAQQDRLSKTELDNLADAIKAVRDLASQFRAFGFNETYALSFVRLVGYDPLKASEGLFGLSNTMETYNPERIHHRTTIQRA
jgi:hypothetical protein